MAKETAEQQLLKIIESTEAQEAKGGAEGAPQENTAQQVAASVKGSGVSVAMPPFIDSILASFKALTSPDKAQMSFGLKDVNRLLGMSIFILLIFYLMDFVNGMKYAKQEFRVSVNEKVGQISREIIPQILEVSEYLSVVAKRNIFQPYEKSEEDIAQEINTVTKQIELQARELKLVGISWLDTPESASALIENSESGITYFLRTGDKINEVVIKEIYADSVILTFNNEEMKLDL